MDQEFKYEGQCQGHKISFFKNEENKDILSIHRTHVAVKICNWKKLIYIFNFDARFKDFLFYPTILNIRFGISLDDEWVYISSKVI